MADRFAAVTSQLLAARSMSDTFESIVGLATAIKGVEDASLTVVRNGRFQTPTASGPLPVAVDAIQYELGSGPCVDAVVDGSTYKTGDLILDSRWPRFAARAAHETGVVSMLSIRLFLEGDDTLAGLNLYSTQPDAFDEESSQAGTLLATHAAIAMTAARRQEKISNLDQALLSNREIGIGIGVLMARQLVTAEQAFDLLRIASQHSHRKIRDIARTVAESGTLDLPPGLLSAALLPPPAVRPA